jgi:RimJ/RimL family protein N-acetyltransferase
MFETSLFKGKLVRLAASTPDDHALIASWSNNDEYLRLADGDPARPASREEVAESEKGSGAPSISYGFRLRTLEDDRLIGMAALFGIQWANRVAMMGIVIGEPDYWGRGYGSDAMTLLLGYAFRELNLYRVGLDVLGYNTRAIRAYEKNGFVLEGTRRGAVCREGARYDVLQYGILCDEWQARQHSSL